MSLIDDMNNTQIDDLEQEQGPALEPEQEQGPGVRFSMPDLSFLAAPTGAGPVDDYIDHPLNFDSTASTGRILRGCTGLCGSLDYALIDIALGVIEKLKEKKEVKKENENAFNYRGQ